jgi:outer membrane lipoprotein-sorting protein
LKSCSALSLLLVLLPSWAAAQTVEEMLQKIDQATNPYKDRVFTVAMTTREPDGSPRRTVMKTAERGQGTQRIMFFREPADVKGMGLLSQDRDTLYVYLPSYHRVRRLAVHAKRQTFQGSVYSFDDMAQITFAPDYSAKVLSDDGAQVAVLELTPRPGRDMQYSKLVATVDRRIWFFTKLEYYDPDGKHVKTETRSNYQADGEGGLMTRLRMVDLRSKTETVIEVLDHKVNVGLSQGLFTKRGLIRGKL